MIEKTSFIWFNGNIVPWNDANVHVMSHALHYGSSVFEGMRCYNSYKGPVIFRHYDHIQRLINSAKMYRIPISWNIKELMEACKMIIRKNNLDNAYIRPIVFVGDVGLEIDPILEYTSDVAIAAFPWKAYLGEDSLTLGINVMVSSWNKVPSNTIPNLSKAGGNYLSSMLMSNEARRHGYHESIGLDIYGYISEGSGENVFIVKDNVLLTPPFYSSILPGIMRDSVLKLAKSIDLELKECVLPRELLYIADEIFMSGTAAEIIPVCNVDGIKIGSGFRGFFTEKIQNLFYNLFTGQTQDRWNWLDQIYNA